MSDRSFTAIANAAGIATIDVQSRPDRWSLQQVTVTASSVQSGALCSIKKNGSLISAVTPNRGTASGEPYVDLEPSDHLVIQWTGLIAGTQCDAYIIFRKKDAYER